MNIENVEFDGAWIVNPVVHNDERGHFFESFSVKNFSENGLPSDFTQDAHSYSRYKSTFRGLHYQAKPSAQALCVSVVNGAIYDYIVDLRTKSPTFGKWTKNLLSGDNKKTLVLSQGFAHGFLTLEDDTTVLYKMSALYNKFAERYISYAEPKIGLDIANAKELIISQTDSLVPLLGELPHDF